MGPESAEQDRTIDGVAPDAMTAEEKRALLGRLLREQGERPVVEPLSFSQERLWFLDQLDPGVATYNIPTSIPFPRRIDVAALERALQEVVRRHDSLRTTFARRADEPVQLVWPQRTVPLEVRDLRTLTRARRHREFERTIEAAAFEPFDLSRGPLLRALLVRLGETDNTLLVTMHHIVSDGWSMMVFAGELEALYGAFAAGHPSPLPPLPIQYPEFARRQRQHLRDDVLEEHLDYWRQRLTGAPELLALPTDRRRPTVQSPEGYVQPFSVPAGVAEDLRALTKQEGATLFMTLLAAFKVLLHRHSGEIDLVVGAPVANRDRPDLETLIGFFVNTLILRTDASGDPTFREYLGRVREAALEAYMHQELPFEKIVEELQPERDLSRNPLVQVVFALQNTGPAAGERPEVAEDSPPFLTHTAKFDITLGMGEAGTGLSGAFECNADVFEAATVTRLTRRFRTLLASIADDPDQPISWLNLLPDDELQQLLVDWNQTDEEFPDACFHHLYEAQADLTPDAIAAECGPHQLTYAQLDQRANQLAHRLVAMGAEVETRVAICVERGLDMAVAVLGVMKAGAAYVPLDTTAPRDRSAFILGDSGAALVVTQAAFADRFEEYGLPVLALDAEAGALAAEPAERPAVAIDPLNLAYLIYTSGSTGVPKGIMVPHRGVGNMGRSEVIDFATGPGDRVLQVAPLIFDVSIWEMAMTWLAGATLVFAAEEEIVSGSILTDAGITVASFTPSVLATLDGRAYPGLDRVITVGEACTERVVAGWAHGRRLINVYGPTETTGHCATADLVDEGEPITIGRPIHNVRLYILDEAMEPVPPGVAGELHVSSPGLTRGYVNRPDLTAERFVPDPFGDEPGRRLYKTGDRVRYLADGRIEFLGRFDDQVKVRGFRIELGEIEAVLAALDGVAEAVAITREDRPGDKRIVAYVVADEGAALDVEQLRRDLRLTLPTYMVPAHIVTLDALPLNPNRKVDRAALPVPGSLRPEPAAPGDRPLTETEAVVASVWEDVLGTSVRWDDNFFDLGGHSLLATKVLVRIADALGVEIPIRALFLGPRVVDLAGVVDEALASGDGARDDAIVPIDRRARTVAGHAAVTAGAGPSGPS